MAARNALVSQQSGLGRVPWLELCGGHIRTEVLMLQGVKFDMGGILMTSLTYLLTQHSFSALHLNEQF